MPIVAMLVGSALVTSALPAVASQQDITNFQTQPSLTAEQMLIDHPDADEGSHSENMPGMTSDEADLEAADPTDDIDLMDSQTPSDELELPDKPNFDGGQMNAEEAPTEDETLAPDKDSLQQTADEEIPSAPAMSPFIVRPPPVGLVLVNYGRWTKKDKVPMRSTNSSSASVVATIPTSGKKVKVSQIKGAWSRVTYGSKSGWVYTANDLTTENTRSFLVYGTLRKGKPNWHRVSNAEARQVTKISNHALYNVKFGKQAYGATISNSSKKVVADQLSFKASEWPATLSRVDALEFNLKVQSGSTLVRFYQRNKATAADGTKSWSYPVSNAAAAKAHLKKHGTAIKSGDLYA